MKFFKPPDHCSSRKMPFETFLLGIVITFSSFKFALKVHSHLVKTEARVKHFFDISRLFFDLFFFAFASILAWCE